MKKNRARLKDEIKLYREEFGGRHLTKEELEKIEQTLERMRTHPNIDNSEDAD